MTGISSRRKYCAQQSGFLLSTLELIDIRRAEAALHDSIEIWVNEGGAGGEAEITLRPADELESLS